MLISFSNDRCSENQADTIMDHNSYRKGELYKIQRFSFLKYQPKTKLAPLLQFWLLYLLFHWLLTASTMITHMPLWEYMTIRIEYLEVIGLRLNVTVNHNISLDHLQRTNLLTFLYRNESVAFTFFQLLGVVDQWPVVSENFGRS